MTLTIAPVVGVPDGGVLPVTFQHVFQDGKVVFCAVIDTAFSAKAKEELKTILEDLRSLELFSLEEAVQKMQAMCSEHAEALGSVAMGLFLDDTVIVLTSGGGTVFLTRTGKQGKLLQSDSPQVVGGKPQSGDQYVFFSQELAHKVQDDWKNYAGEVTKIADSLSIEILQERMSARYAGMIVQVGATAGGDQPPGDSSGRDRSPILSRIRQGVLGGIKKLVPMLGRLIKKSLLGLLSGARWTIENLRDLDTDELKEQSKNTITSFRQPRRFIPLVLLVGLIGIGILWNTVFTLQTDSRVAAVLAPLESELVRMQTSEIENLQTRREEAAALVDEVRRAQAEHRPRSAERRALDAFLVSAEQYSEEISGKAELSTLDVYYNFRLLNGSFVATQTAKTDTTAYFLDGENRLIVTLDLSSKQARMISMEGVPGLLDLTILGNAIYVLAEDGIYQVTSANGSTRRVIDRAETWQTPTLLTSFGQNLYLFDLGSGALLRYAGTQGEFETGSNWIRSSQGFPLTSVSSIAVDGRVWLGSQTGVVAAFSAGTRDSLTIAGLPEPLDGTVDLYTDADAEHIYVLSRHQQRVLKLTKQGEFLQEWSNPDLAAATHILAAEPNGYLLISAGSQVFQIPLE